MRRRGRLRGRPGPDGLGSWAAAHGVAALLVVKPSFPWPDPDAFIDRTICVAGLGLAAGTRLSPDQGPPLAEVVARLDRLRG